MLLEVRTYLKSKYSNVIKKRNKKRTYSEKYFFFLPIKYILFSLQFFLTSQRPLAIEDKRLCTFSLRDDLKRLIIIQILIVQKTFEVNNLIEFLHTETWTVLHTTHIQQGYPIVSVLYSIVIIHFTSFLFDVILSLILCQTI